MTPPILEDSEELRSDIPPPTLAETFFGLLSDPEEILPQLVAVRHHRYILTAIFSLLAVIFTPLAYYFCRFNFLQTNFTAIMGLALILLATTLIFFATTPWFLKVFGIEISTSQIAESFGYAISPLIPLVLFYYGINLFFLGRLTGVLYLITGVKDAYDWLLPALPILHIVGKILFINIFCRSIRIMLGIGFIESIIIAAISAVPFYLSLMLSTAIAGMLHPYLADIIWRFLSLFSMAWE